MNPFDFIIVGVLLCLFFTGLFVVWFETTDISKWPDIWCPVCKKNVRFWSSHVYSKEHKENLAKVRGQK